MKKTWLIVLAVIALAALSIGIAVPTLAHNAGGNTAATPLTTADVNFLGGPHLALVAEALGLTTDELTARLQNGETLAQIASAQGIAESTIIDAIVAPFTDQVALRVKYGYLTQEAADELLQEARDNAAAFLTTDLSSAGDFGDWHEEMEEYCEQAMGGSGFGGMMGGGFGGGMMGGWNDEGVTSGNGNSSRYGFGGGMMGGRGFGGGMMGW